jgi:hypothetical protein
MASQAWLSCSPIVNQVVHSKKLPVSPSKSSSISSPCQQGKSHRFHFSYSPSISNKPLQLLFLDVWGPASTTSVNNNRFYLSVVDDFSKYTWLFPLATKSEVCATFLRFKQLVETFFNTKIRSVQSDNGGKFRPLQTALNSMGVSYRLSCPHTHHQMGTVERKHRHIVETGLSLLATVSVPFTFWDTAFETTTYLINRLPSKITKKKSPYECLFHLTPDYKYVKIFGCECWPFLRPYQSSKLSFRFSSCVFTAYSKNHLGYECLHIPSDRVYIARHVVFNENSFPFSTSSPHRVSSPPQTPSSLSIPCVQSFPSQNSASCPNTPSSTSPNSSTSTSPSATTTTPPNLQTIVSFNPSSNSELASSPEPLSVLPARVHGMTTRSQNQIYKPYTHLLMDE